MYQVGIVVGGVRAERAIIPTPKFWAVKKLSKNLFPVHKFSSRYVQKFYAKNLHFREILSSWNLLLVRLRPSKSSTPQLIFHNSNSEGQGEKGRMWTLHWWWDRVMLRLHDEANMKSTSCMCILNTFASCMLPRVNGVKMTAKSALYKWRTDRRTESTVGLGREKCGKQWRRGKGDIREQLPAALNLDCRQNVAKYPRLDENFSFKNAMFSAEKEKKPPPL